MPKKPVRQVESWWFVLPDDRVLDAAEQGRFLLAPLTQAERLRAWDERERIQIANGTIVQDSRAFRQARELVLSNLVSTENVPSDAPSAWPGREAPREQREAWLEANLDDFDVVAIGVEIRERSTLGPAEKN